MAVKFKPGQKVMVVRNLGGRSPEYGDENKYYYGGSPQELNIGSVGEIFEVEGKNKVRVRFPRTRWAVHPDEIQLVEQEVDETTAMLRPVMRHPLFELAEQAPVFILNGKVYACTDGEVVESENVFTDKKLFGLIEKTKTVVEVATVDSLDELLEQRSAEQIDRTQKNYAKRILDEQVMKHAGLSKDLDTAQLIYKKVFPYLRADGYDAKVLGVLGVDGEEVRKENRNGKPKKSPEVEKIVRDLYEKVEGLINEIETPETPKKRRTEKQIDLDRLLGNGEALEVEEQTDSILGKLAPRDYAIVKGKVYNLVSDNGDDFVRIDGRKYGFSLLEREVEIPIAQEFGKGTRVRIKEGTRYSGDTRAFGTMQGKFGSAAEGSDEQWAVVHFDDGSHNQYTEKDLEFAEEKKEIKRTSSAEDLESKFYEEISKKLRVDALRKHLSKEKILELVLDKEADVLAFRGKSAYDEGDFGFITKSGRYYAYLWVPEFALKSQFDDNLYLFRRARTGFMVYRDGDKLCYEGEVRMIDNNNHPFLHNKDQDFADLCVGRQEFPTSGKDNGEVIAKRLRRAKEMLMFGYTSGDYRSCYKLIKKCNTCQIAHFSENLISQADAKRRNIPIIEGGYRR